MLGVIVDHSLQAYDQAGEFYSCGPYPLTEQYKNSAVGHRCPSIVFFPSTKNQIDWVEYLKCWVCLFVKRFLHGLCWLLGDPKTPSTARSGIAWHRALTVDGSEIRRSPVEMVAFRCLVDFMQDVGYFQLMGQLSCCRLISDTPLIKTAGLQDRFYKQRSEAFCHS